VKLFWAKRLVQSNLMERVLVFKAYRLLYHSTLGLRVIKKKKKNGCSPEAEVLGLVDEVEVVGSQTVHQPLRGQVVRVPRSNLLQPCDCIRASRLP